MSIMPDNSEENSLIVSICFCIAIILIFLLFTTFSCTCTLQNTFTQGEAADVGDSKPTSNMKAELKIPFQ